MYKSYQFPIKGTFYYAAAIVIDESLMTNNTLFELQAEPGNAYDQYAVQIFLRPPQAVSANTLLIPNDSNPNYPGLLLGYVPRQLAPLISQPLKSHAQYSLQVIHKAKMGRHIEMDCLLRVQLPWFTALNLRLLTLWVQQLNHFKKLRRYLHNAE
jgi:hypothetical protein